MNQTTGVTGPSVDEALAKVENAADVQITRTTTHGHPAAVLTDASSYSVLFNRARTTGHGRTLRLKAPRKRGVYRLYVEAAGHAAKALVVVG